MKALIEMASGRVCQIADDAAMFPISPYLMWLSVPQGLDVQPEWSWDGAAGTFTAPAGPPVVPQSVTAVQARKALNAAGLRAAVDGWVAQQDQDVKDAWDYADPVHRDNAIVLAAAAALGWTNQQLDDLFVTAAAL